MPKRFVLLSAALVVIVALFLGYFYWFNPLLQVPVFEGAAPPSPLRISLKPQLVSVDHVSIDVTIASDLQKDIPDVRLQVETFPQMKVVGVPASSFVAHPKQSIQMNIQLIGTPADKAELVKISAVTPPEGGVGVAAGFYLEPQNGQWQILSENDYGRRHPAPVRTGSIKLPPESLPEPSPTPQSSLPLIAPAGTITVTGRWAYLDHAVTPAGIATT